MKHEIREKVSVWKQELEETISDVKKRSKDPGLLKILKNHLKTLDDFIYSLDINSPRDSEQLFLQAEPAISHLAKRVRQVQKRVRQQAKILK